jgi:tetraacyldisaccharide 4'-kinase
MVMLARDILYKIGIFKRYKINAKVISVGNITWGGTGKTPVTAFIADVLAKKNLRVSILIRGYGNDESELLPKLTSNTPVLVGRDRVKTGKEAVEKHLSGTVVLDDGLQYMRLKRDLDIVCVDASKPFGNGWVIPAGILREGLYGLKRADIFLITKADLVSDKSKLERLEKKLKSINRRAVIVKTIHRPLHFYKLVNEEKINIGELQSKELVLVSAIGSPECFEKTIQRLGLKINKHFIFRDHHAYTKEDIAAIEDYCVKNNVNRVVTTEKDAVKIKPGVRSPESGAVEYLVLKVRLEIIENEDGFYDRLFGIYNS